jgi:adenylate cyclase
MRQTTPLPDSTFAVPQSDSAISSRHRSMEERRIGSVRVAALFGAVVTAVYICYHFVSNRFSLRPFEQLAVSIEFAFFCLFVAAIVAARSYRIAVSYLLLAVFCTLFTLMACLFGREGGSHMFLLILGPIAALTLEIRRPHAVLAICLVAALLHLAIQFYIPPSMNPYAPFWPQIGNPFRPAQQAGQAHAFYIMGIFAIEFGVGLCTYFAMRWAMMAEAALMREFARSELLLANLLPASIAARLKDRPNDIIAESFDSISILFADVVNFTPASAARPPQEVIDFLGRLFAEFDGLAERHGLEKIKTIGDCYMVAGGMPERSEGHVRAMAEMALDMIALSATLTAGFDPRTAIRVGMHLGPAMAGVIGHTKPYYDVWGDTINVAARLEAASDPGSIQVSAEVRQALGPDYRFVGRGLVDIRGKGPMELYFLTGRSIA